VRGKVLRFEPCIASAWKSYQVKVNEGSSCYEIRVLNPAGVSSGVVSIELDGQPAGKNGPEIPFVDDGKPHLVVVTLGNKIAVAEALPHDKDLLTNV
jgi:cyclic beta-1,2-glucan synthetase